MNAPTKSSAKEFVALMAVLSSLAAFAIDSIVPVLPAMANDLQTDQRQIQLVIPVLFAGFSLGLLIYGPLSDTTGRKKMIYYGLGVFILGSFICYLADGIEVMLMGRFLQGLGAASGRSLSVAMIRDIYNGSAMAKVTSSVMSVFILVPVIAPSLGQLISHFTNWRVIFGVLMIQGVIALFWFMRQSETLHVQNRRPFSLKQNWQHTLFILKSRTSCGYTVALGLTFGAFIGYLILARPILQDQYQLGFLFSLYFAVNAIAIAIAGVVNAKLVMRYGMHKLSVLATQIIALSAFVFFGVVWWYSGQPPLPIFAVYMFITNFCMGILFGNINALAMERLGNIAGIGSSVLGCLSNLIGTLIGSLIGQMYNHTLFPLVIGFLITGSLSCKLLQYSKQ